MLTVGSLFAGIGGFDLGLERAGMRTVWQSELDPYCQRVLARHWPDVQRIPDVHDVNADTVPRVDVICGGFPCQGLSDAGLRLGLLDPRSGLWSEYARIVGDLRPRYVIVENVAALLRRGLGTVLADLAALGYDAEWDCIPASAVGAPHRRDRIWLVAYPNGTGLEGRRGERGVPVSPNGQARRRPAELADPSCERRDWGRNRPDTSQGARPRDSADRCRPPRDPEGWWATEPDVGRVAHGVPARMDRLRALGNALVPQIAEWIGRRILDHEGLTDTASDGA